MGRFLNFASNRNKQENNEERKWNIQNMMKIIEILVSQVHNPFCVSNTLSWMYTAQKIEALFRLKLQNSTELFIRII